MFPFFILLLFSNCSDEEMLIGFSFFLFLFFFFVPNLDCVDLVLEFCCLSGVGNYEC